MTPAGNISNAPLPVINGSGQLNVNINADNWATTGYNFLYASGTADTTGANGNAGGNPIELWGPHTASPNGLPASSSTGSNFISADGNFEQGAISQAIGSTLTVGQVYAVSF